MVDNRDAPHPDDVKRIFEAVAEVFTGKTDRAEVANIRLRRFGGGWTVVNGSGAVIRHEGGPQLGLIEMKVIGESDEPDPVPATDPGHPGLTVDPGRTREIPTDTAVLRCAAGCGTKGEVIGSASVLWDDPWLESEDGAGRTDEVRLFDVLSDRSSELGCK